VTSIAIVGAEGSGKTVLITALAKHFEQPRDSVTLIASNKPTAAYVARCWSTMKDGEWPPSTTPGETVELSWQLKYAAEKYELRIVDSPGQDLRALFSDDQIKDLDLGTGLQPLAEYVRNADVVVLLVNLKDFGKEVPEETKLDNEWILQGALDYCFKRVVPPVCGLVFTQMDNYSPAIQDHGSLSEVAAKYLPHVHAKYLQAEKVPILKVQAVDRVKPQASGKESTQLVPVWEDGASHPYLNDLMVWIVEACQKAQIAQDTRWFWEAIAWTRETYLRGKEATLRILAKLFGEWIPGSKPSEG